MRKKATPPTATNTPESPVHVFFVATTKVEKINQLNELARIQRNKCIFLPITALGKPAHSPDEEKRTFSGNLGEKLYGAAYQLNGYSREQAVQALKDIGFKADDIDTRRVKLYGMAEDSGYSFANGDIAQEFLTYYLNPKNAKVKPQDREMVQGIMKYSYLPEKPFPGAETVDVVAGCGGVSNFMRLIKEFGEACGYNVNPKDNRKNDWINFVNSATIGTFAWEPGKKIEPAMLGSKIKETAGAHLQVYTGATYPPGKERMTYDYMATLSAAKDKRNFRSDASRGIEYQPYSRLIAYQRMMIALEITSLYKHQYSTYERTLASDRGTEISDSFKVGLLSPATGFTAITHQKHIIDKLHADKMQVNVPDTDSSSYTLHEEVLDNDAFYVMAPKDAHDSNAMLEHHALLSTLLVHKQLDPDGKNKPLIVQYDVKNSDVEMQDNAWVTGYFNQGVYGDRPSQTITRVYDDGEGLSRLKEARSEYRRVHRAAKNVPRAPKIESDYFHVAVFCSASLDGVFYEKGYNLGKALAENNFGMAWGAGDRHMMGSVYDGYKGVQKEQGIKGSMIGSTTEVIGKTETKKGEKPEGLDHYYAAETITDRMDYLFVNSQAYVFLEGGPGTLQEFYRYTWYARNQPEVVEGKPVIIAQSAYLKDPLLHHAVDQFLGKPYASLNVQEKQACGITILEPEREAPEGKKLFEAEVKKIIALLKPHRDAFYKDRGSTPPMPNNLSEMLPPLDLGYLGR